MLNQSAIKLIEEKLEKLRSDITNEENNLKELTKRYEANYISMYLYNGQLGTNAPWFAGTLTQYLYVLY